MSIGTGFGIGGVIGILGDLVGTVRRFVFI